jgi:hypothetical protein
LVREYVERLKINAMTWSDKLQDFQATLYANIIDYLNENGDNDYIRYDKEKDEIYFLVSGEWVSEYAVDIFDVVDIADEFGIRYPYKD